MSKLAGLKALDLCAGRGGWSKGLADAGFEVEGLDIIDVGYPYKLTLADIRSVSGSDYRGYDVIVGSPPCREFSRITNIGYLRWKRAPDPELGLELVREIFRIVEEADPKIWLMENVDRLAKYLDLKPRITGYLTGTMRRSFWGNFPLFLIPRDMTAPKIEDVVGPNRSAKRAEIPYLTAHAFAVSCKDYLLNNKEEVTTNE